MPTQEPERPQGPGQTQTELSVALLRHRPLECRANILQLALRPVEPCLLVLAEKVRLDVLAQSNQEHCSSPLHPWSFAARLQTVESILADRLQHPEAGVARDLRARSHQVLVHQ